MSVWAFCVDGASETFCFWRAGVKMSNKIIRGIMIRRAVFLIADFVFSFFSFLSHPTRYLS